MPKPEARTPHNSLRASLDGVRTTSHPPLKASEVTPTEILPLIREAAVATGLSQKELAINARCTESELSDGLSGARRFSATWLWAQPDRFLLKFFDLVMDARQLRPENVRAIQRQRIVELIELLLKECA